jgi:three-Cys-motif partner protein
MAKKRKKFFEQEERLPFDFLPESTPNGISITLDPLRYPIWTENKARLIEHYLYLFVQITKHGTYIDGFAGPQDLNKPELWPEMWAAKLVLESEPKRLRHFYLFDKGRKQYKALKALEAEQPVVDKKGKKIYREIVVKQGDFNVLVHELLSPRPIRESEATFCLLDQRTFECHWQTVEALAKYKKEGRKIELFYFLAIAWLDRALAAQKKTKVIEDWWGRDDWPNLREMGTQVRVNTFTDRFKDELGYKWVMAWPIFKRQNTGNIMYYMIHATDHPAAPQLMHRAYHESVKPKAPPKEVQMELAGLIEEYGEEDPEDFNGEQEK